MTAWLRGGAKYSCSVVMAELATQNQETPDVLGFYGPGCSVLIECKVSRSDFLADKKKSFRQLEDWGMGDKRYYAAPKGMLSPDELPEGWGLLEICGRYVREKKLPDNKPAEKRAEVKMLMSAIRRLEISSAVFVQHEENVRDELPLTAKESNG